MFKDIAIAALFALSSAASAQNCGPTPYTIAFKEAKGKLTVKVPDGLKNIGPGNASLTADFLRRMFSATAPVVLDEVLDAYECHVAKAIDDSKPSEDRRVELMDAWSEIRAQLSDAAGKFSVAWSTSNDAGLAASPVNDKKDLTAQERALAPFIAKIPVENFTRTDGLSLYGDAVFNGLPVNACAGFIRSALVENEAGIQHFAAALRPALVTYVASVKNGSRDAKMRLYTQARSIQAVSAASTATSTAMEICRTAAPNPTVVMPAAPTPASATK